jgi:hypothetical protein
MRDFVIMKEGRKRKRVEYLTYQVIDASWLERVHGEGGPHEASGMEEKGVRLWSQREVFGGSPRRHAIGHAPSLHLDDHASRSVYTTQ